MAANVRALPLQVKTTRGWRMGLSTMLDKEMGEWFRTKTWLIQTMIWVLLANGFVAMVLFDERIAGGDEVRSIATMMFFLFGGMAPAVGAAIGMQDSIIGEKESGTAAWVLSKPLSRVAFVASKLFANSVGMLLTAIAIPGLVFFVMFALSKYDSFAPSRLAAAQALNGLNMLFWLTLTTMLGTFFRTRAPVIGIPLALLFGYQGVLAVAPALWDYMPYQLVVPLGDAGMPMAGRVLHGQPVGSATPIIGTALMIVVFVVVALWRFEREEM